MKVESSLNFQKSLAILSAFKAAGELEFHIVLSSGDSFGEAISNKTNRKASKDRKRGFLRDTYEKVIGDMAVGELRVVGLDGLPDIDLSRLQSTLSSFAGSRWGIGSYTTAANKKDNVVEILRIK